MYCLCFKGPYVSPKPLYSPTRVSSSPLPIHSIGHSLKLLFMKLGKLKCNANSKTDSGLKLRWRRQYASIF